MGLTVDLLADEAEAPWCGVVECFPMLSHSCTVLQVI